MGALLLSCSGARRHLLLRCANQPIVHGTGGVVNLQHSSAVLFATVKGAYDMSLKISFVFFEIG